MRHRSTGKFGFLASKVARRRVFVAGIAALGASTAAVGSALPAGAADTPVSTAQNSIIVGTGSATTYNMMQAIDLIFNQAELSGCPMFESAVGQGSQPQNLDFRCATYGTAQSGVTVTGGSHTVTVSTGTFPSGINPGEVITGANIVNSPPTTVVSGGGTNTITMSQNASGSSSPTETLTFTGVFGPGGGSSAVNPYNDAGVQEPPLGSSNGIAAIEGLGGAFGTTGVDDYTGVNYARSSRDISGDDPGLNFVAYAKDGVPWIHFSKVGGLPTPSAKVVSLTQAQLQGIFLGASGSAPVISEWNQVQIGTQTCAAVGPVAVPGVSLASGSPTLTDSSGFPGSVVDGQFIVGTDIPSGTTVMSVSGTTLTMTANATATVASESVTFETYNNPECTAIKQIVPVYAVPLSNTSPIIVVAAQEGSGTQGTFKTFLGKDPSANNKVNCDTGVLTAGAPTCYGPLVVFENQLYQITPNDSGSGGYWQTGQDGYLTPPSGSALPWSTTQGGAGSLSQVNLYQDMIFFYSYGKWAEQCLAKECGDMKIPAGDTGVLGDVGGTANPGSGTHTGANAATWAIGVKPTESTILGAAACPLATVSNVAVTNASNSVTVPSGGFPGVSVGENVTGAGIPANATVSAISGNTLTLSANATATNASEVLNFSCTGGTGDGRFPIDRYLYNVYSNGTQAGIPEATAATINYVSEVGAICKASNAFNIDPNTGKTYLSEYQAVIKAGGFFPLSAGAAAGTINSLPLDEGDVGGSVDGYALLQAYAAANPGKADVDFITPNTDQEYSSSAWGSGQTNGTFVNASTSDPEGYCLVSTTGT